MWLKILYGGKDNAINLIISLNVICHASRNGQIRFETEGNSSFGNAKIPPPSIFHEAVIITTLRTSDFSRHRGLFQEFFWRLLPNHFRSSNVTRWAACPLKVSSNQSETSARDAHYNVRSIVCSIVGACCWKLNSNFVFHSRRRVEWVCGPLRASIFALLHCSWVQVLNMLWGKKTYLLLVELFCDISSSVNCCAVVGKPPNPCVYPEG